MKPLVAMPRSVSGADLGVRPTKKIVLIAVALGCAAAQMPSSHPREAGPLRAGRSEMTARLDAGGQSIRPVRIRNYIDRYIFEKMDRDHIPHAGLAVDAEFLRRVTLDLTGRLPQPEAIRKFLQDSDPDKRDKVIDALMTTPYLKHLVRDEAPFVDRWAYFFGDLFRSGTAQLGKGRNLFHDYLYMSVLMNVPYDELVRDMITARARSNWLDAPSNFLVRDHVDDDSKPERVNDEDTYDEAAITTTKLFLGVNLECVSCHFGQGAPGKNQSVAQPGVAGADVAAGGLLQQDAHRPAVRHRAGVLSVGHR
jgi:hypothetical protein